MQAYREIVDSEKLGKIIKLPCEFRHKQVEIIVLPVKDKQMKKKKLSQNWANALSDYREQYTSIELQKKALEWRGE